MGFLKIVGISALGVGLAGAIFVKSVRILKNKKFAFNPGPLGKHYKGAFDQVMKPKEAALILGIRETSTRSQIQKAHRALMMANHPDNGGSTFLSSKINEAKEMLAKNAKE